MKPFRPGRRSLTQIFAWPLAVGALSTVGLVSALVGDGVWDGLSWLTLPLPILLYVAFLARGRRRTP